MFKIRDKKTLIRVLIALQLIIIVCALAINFELDKKISFEHDKILMHELSGAGVIAGLDHRKRHLVIIASPISPEDICKIVGRHYYVTLDRIIYSESEETLQCAKFDLENSI